LSTRRISFSSTGSSAAIWRSTPIARSNASASSVKNAPLERGVPVDRHPYINAIDAPSLDAIDAPALAAIAARLTAARRCIGASCKGECLCCVKRCCFKFGVPPLTCCESFVDKEVCCQLGLCCCALGVKCPTTCIKHQGQCCCLVSNIALPCDSEIPISCAICFLACHPTLGVCVRLKHRWPHHHKGGGAPPNAETMDGKEENRVVEEEPGFAHLESLDVVDKVSGESAALIGTPAEAE